MAAPAFAGAGAGVLVATGSQTVSDDGAGASGDALILQVLTDAAGQAASISSGTNLENLAGTDGTLTSVAATNDANLGQQIWIGRKTAGGTASISVTTVGADLYCRMYRFTDMNTGTTLADVLENSTAGTAPTDFGGVAAQVNDRTVVTLGDDRLALNFVNVNDDNQASMTSFTGETGGDWTEVVAAYGSSTGTDGAIQCQAATIASAGTIDGGSYTMAAADAWCVTGFALIGTTVAAAAPVTRDPWPWLQAVNRSNVY